MKVQEIFQEAITPEKQRFLDIIYKKKAGSKITDKVGLWIWNNLMFINDEITPQNPKQVEKYLTSLGYSKEQLHLFRDLFTQTTKSVLDYLQNKHGKEAIPDKYVAAGPEWYGVYTLYLNVDEKYHAEFKKVVKQIFLKKIDKMNDSDFIPENK